MHVCISFHMSVLFFQLFPPFPVSVPSLFLLGLILFVPKVNKLVSLLLPRLLLALVVFSPSLLHCLALSFLFPSTCFPLRLSTSPLGFSPVERLNREGNDCVTMFDSAECFGYVSVEQTLNLCVRNTEFLAREA